MDRGGFAAMLREMADGWQCGDSEAVARFFAEDVSYGDPTRYRFRRRADLLPFFAPPMDGRQTCVWHRIVFDESAQEGAAEYTYEGHHRYHGAVLVTVRNERVVAWREWQHESPLDWESFVAGPDPEQTSRDDGTSDR